MLAKIDWIKIKNEYINTNISQRSLAEKYKVPYQTIRDKAIKEKWFDKKKEQRSKIGAKMEQKTAEKIIEANVSYAKKLIEISEKTIDAVEKAVEQLEIVVVEGVAVKTGVVNTYKIRQITQSIKDLKDIIAPKENGAGEEDNAQTGVVVLPEVVEHHST